MPALPPAVLNAMRLAASPAALANPVAAVLLPVVAYALISRHVQLTFTVR